MTSASVTVVIPAYNAAPFIRDTLASVLSQTVPPSRVVVVDDGSTDGTGDLARSVDERVTVVTQENTGLPATGRNRGAALADTRWLAFLDADDLWLPSKLERQLAAAAESGADFLYTDRRNIGDRGPLPEIQSQIQPLHSGDVFESLLVLGNYITLSGVLMATDVFRSLGGFDERRALRAAEDWDLWVRVAAEHRVEAIDEPLVCYRIHGGMTSGNPRGMRQARSEVIRRAIESPRGQKLTPSTRRRVLAATARTNGWDSGRRGVWHLALLDYARAVSLRPFDLQTYRDFARTALGRS